LRYAEINGTAAGNDNGPAGEIALMAHELIGEDGGGDRELVRPIDRKDTVKQGRCRHSCHDTLPDTLPDEQWVAAGELTR
jgi:hypothetical protein